MKKELSNRIKEQEIAEASLYPKFPYNMLLEVTNICNHNCIFCAHSKATRPVKTIDENLAKNILTQAFELGTREVGFYCCGEPLVDPKLETYIKFAKELGYSYTYITTNGALFNEQRIMTLIEAGIDSVKFSINAATKETYILVHGRDDFNKVLHNLKTFDCYRRKAGRKINLFVSSILCRYTLNDEFKLREMLSEYCDEIEMFYCVNQGGVMPEVNEYLSCEGVNVNGASLSGNKCFMPFNKLYVSCEGYMTICCTDFQNYLATADLNKDKLDVAWNSDIMVDVRRKFISEKYEGLMCERCLLNNRNKVVPLCPELATQVDLSNWDNGVKICERIEKYQKGEN